MKIIFLQEYMYEWQAPMVFSAIAKDKGNKTQLIIDGDSRRAVKKVLLQSPDLIIFSNITSGNMAYVYNCAAIIKQQSNIPILAGGVFISLHYDNINMEYIDILGIGEGETMFEQLLNTSFQSHLYKNVSGLVYKDGGKLYVNNPLFKDNLDTIPFPDRQIYYHYDVFKKEKVRMFYSGRGCKYNCSYCCVPVLNNMDCSIQKVRKRSPENLLKEILEVNSRWGMKAAFFQDDTFTQDAVWLKEFLHLYKKYVNKPYMCLSRAHDIAELTVLDLLYKSGCISVGIGIETSNERIRSDTLNRFESNDEIKHTVKLLQERKIRITTFNMIGIPGESVKEISNTILFNQELKINSAWAVFYHSYRDKWMAGNAAESCSGNFYTRLPGDYPQREYFELVQKYFPFIVKHYWLSKIIKLKTSRYFSYIAFAMHSFYREVYIWHRSFWLSLIAGIKNQLQYKKKK